MRRNIHYKVRNDPDYIGDAAVEQQLIEKINSTELGLKGVQSTILEYKFMHICEDVQYAQVQTKWLTDLTRKSVSDGYLCTGKIGTEIFEIRVKNIH